MIAPDVVSVATPEGDRAVVFGIDGAEYHALNEAGDVLAVGPLSDVVARSVERFRII